MESSREVLMTPDGVFDVDSKSIIWPASVVNGDVEPQAIVPTTALSIDINSLMNLMITMMIVVMMMKMMTKMMASAI